MMPKDRNILLLKSEKLLQVKIYRISLLTSSEAWSLNARFIFYILLNENHRPSKVMRHKIGTSQADDVLVMKRKMPVFVSLSQSRSESLIFISAHDHETSEVHMINAADPEQKPVTIAPKSPI